MSRLFIEFYLDEDVDVLIASLLRARGFAAITTLEAENIGAEDSRQLEYAAQQRKTLVSHNRVHFENLAADYFASKKRHAGLIIAVRRPPHEITKRLLAILNHITADEMGNQLIYV